MSSLSAITLAAIVVVIGLACIGASWPFTMGVPIGFTGLDLAGAFAGGIAALIGTAIGLVAAGVALVISLLVTAVVALPFLILLALPLAALIGIVVVAARSSNKRTSQP